jgi:hypothetical protein
MKNTIFQFGNIYYMFGSTADRDAAVAIWASKTSQADFEAKMSTAGIAFSQYKATQQ